jgi:hypothetical protein
MPPQISLAPRIVYEQAPHISATFKAVFFTVVVFTLFASIAAIWLAYFYQNRGTLTAIQQAAQQSVFDTMNTTVKLGLGAILGLIGGGGNSDQNAARAVRRASRGLARLPEASAPGSCQVFALSNPTV